VLERYFTLRPYLLSKIRDFFNNDGYIEVETPYVVPTVPPDPHIEPLLVYIGDVGPYFLHTSPEIYMKKILARGLKRIYQICRAFRVENKDELHSLEFTMLEWYREGSCMEALKETERLVDFLSSYLESDFGIKKSFSPPFRIFDMEELFLERLNISPFNHEKMEFYIALKEKNIVSVREDDSWLDMFFKAFFERIEPSIDKSTPYFITGWPIYLSSMAKAKDGKAERFELYVRGVEIANGYSELLDPTEQRKRFEEDNNRRKMMGKREFIIDGDFISCLSKIEGEYSGCAVGVERLMMVLLGEEDIDRVSPFNL